MDTRRPPLPRPAADSSNDSHPSALIRIVAAATFVAAALRLFRLGHQSLWIDEVFTWASAGGGGALGMRDLLDNVHGPLYSLVLHAWMRVAGESEWALRFPSAVAGVLTVPALAWLSGLWLGRRSVVPAAWLAAGSPFLVWYSQETRNYAWLILWAVLATATVLELQRRLSASGVARYALAAAAAALSNLSFALLLPLHLRLWLGGEPATRPRRRAVLAIVAAVLALVALPWLPRIAGTWDWQRLAPRHHAEAAETALRGTTTFHAAAVPFALHAFAVGYTLGPSLRELRAHAGLATLRPHLPELAASALTFGALGVLGLLALARRRRLADTILWLVAPMLVVSYFASRNFKVFHPRYVAVSLPCVLLVFAAAFTDMPSRWRRLFAVAVGVLWGVSLYQNYFVPAYGREDYRGALAVVRAGIVPGEQVLAVGMEEPVAFYARDLRVSRFWLGYANQPEKFARKLDETLAPARGTWVVLSRAEDLDPGDRFARTLSSQWPRAGTWNLPGVRVWHLTALERRISPEAGRSPTAAP